MNLIKHSEMRLRESSGRGVVRGIYVTHGVSLKFVISNHGNWCLNKIFILAISARVPSYRVVEILGNTFQLTKVSIHFDIHQIWNLISFFLSELFCGAMENDEIGKYDQPINVLVTFTNPNISCRIM